MFVYGTLQPGEPRWPQLRPFAHSWAPATATGRLWDTGHGYPAARFDRDGDELPGVAVILTDGCAAVGVLDDIEGEGVLFERLEIPTSRGPAYSYQWLGGTDGLSPLRHGCHRSDRDRDGLGPTPGSTLSRHLAGGTTERPSPRRSERLGVGTGTKNPQEKP